MICKKYVFYKTKSIFEKLITPHPKIKLVFHNCKGATHTTREFKRNYTIHIFDNYAEWLLNYRNFTHELSHILFDTFKIDKYIDKIAQETNLPIPVVRYVANIFEDYRVDHLYYKLYPGAKKLDEKINKYVRSLIDPYTENIFVILLATLTNNDDVFILHDNKFAVEISLIARKCFEKLKDKDYRATVAVTTEFLRSISKYIKNKNVHEALNLISPIPQPQFQPQSQPQEQQQQQELKQQQEEELTEELGSSLQLASEEFEPESESETKPESSSEEPSKETSNEEKEEAEKGEPSKEEETRPKEEELEPVNQESNETISEVLQETEFSTEEADSLGEQVREFTSMGLNNFISEFYDDLRRLTKEDEQEIEQFLASELSSIYQESERQATVFLQEIQEKLKSFGLQEVREEKGIIGKVRITPEYFIGGTETFTPIDSVVNQLSQLFKRIKGKVQYLNDISGVMIDTEQEIQSEFDPNIKETFIQEEHSVGLNIVVLLDLSNSMRANFDRLDMAVKSCLTLYKALSSVPNITFKVIGFSALYDNTVIISELNYEQLQRVNTGIYTPTHSAIRYATNILEQHSDKKIIILITDGYPELDNISNNIVANWTKYEIKRARRKGISVYTFFLMPHYDEDTIIRIFGPRHTWEICTEPEHLPKKLFNFVSTKVVRSILSGGG